MFVSYVCGSDTKQFFLAWFLFSILSQISNRFFKNALFIGLERSFSKSFFAFFFSSVFISIHDFNQAL